MGAVSDEDEPITSSAQVEDHPSEDDEGSDENQDNEHFDSIALNNKILAEQSRVKLRNLRILTLVAVFGVVIALVLVIAIPKGNSGPSEEKEIFVDSLDDESVEEDDEMATQPPQVFTRPRIPVYKQTELLGGRFVTTRDATSELSLSWDIADMLSKAANDTAGKKEVYLNGNRSFGFDEDGIQVKRSLSGLSFQAGGRMKYDPLYNFFRQAFLEVGSTETDESLGFFDDHPVEQYANTLVMDLFELGRPGDIEATAALVLNVWMSIAHELNAILASCRTEGNEEEEKQYREAALDRAAALYIGNDQVEGDSFSGYMLYRHAEAAGVHFGQDDDALLSETTANKVIVENLNLIKIHIAENKCDSGEEDDYVELRNIVDTIYGYMTVPLLQQLILSIARRDGDLTELYALSFASRVRFCDPQAYEDMMSMMIQSDLEESLFQDAFDVIEGIMDKCLHVTCDMLGTMNELSDNWFPVNENNETTVITTPCEVFDVDEFYSEKVAGYWLSDNVDKLSHIDNDIFQIRTLLNSYAYDSALDYYLYGQNSRPKGELLSLRELATSDVRENVPTFELFSESYAHETIMSAFRREGRFEDASKDQITEVIVSMLQTLVMPFAVLESLYVAVNTCKTKSDDTDLYGFSKKDFTDHFVRVWDVGAAFYIGSLEGEEDTGDENGTLMFSVAKNLCLEFGTCANTDFARVNINLIRALGDGKVALSLNECDGALEILESRVVPQLLIPLLQGTLYYAEVNSRLEPGTESRTLAAGFAFSRAILPLIYNIDREAAEIIAKNTEFQLKRQPVEDGIETVYRAMERIVQTGELGVVMQMLLSRQSSTIQLTA